MEGEGRKMRGGNGLRRSLKVLQRPRASIRLKQGFWLSFFVILDVSVSDFA